MWTGLPYDMEIWFKTGEWMNQGINIYIQPDHIGYPPLWAFWCNAAYQIYQNFGSQIEIWNFFIKLPLILGHLALTFIVGKFASERFDSKTGRRIFFFILMWSFLIFIAAAWGQINILSALFTFLAFYAAVKNRLVTSAFLLGLAVTLKIYPLIVLPAFFIYILKKSGGKLAGKFTLITCALPILFTSTVFIAYGWDIIFFLKTIFYWTPVFESNPVQILSGCMNIWSFVAALKVNMADLWILRMLWIPALAAVALIWLRKRKFKDASLNLSIISFYLIFMISYSWVTEQTFLDPLPFIFIQVLAYNPKKTGIYILAGIQGLVYLFSAVNWGAYIFSPLIETFQPTFLPAINFSDPTLNETNWIIRGTLGLIISITLGIFLLYLLKPTWFTRLGLRIKEIYFSAINQRKVLHSPLNVNQQFRSKNCPKNSN
jgi:hypothetical protein